MARASASSSLPLVANDRLQARAPSLVLSGRQERSRGLDWCAAVTGGLTGLLVAVAIRQMARRIVQLVLGRWYASTHPLAQRTRAKTCCFEDGFLKCCLVRALEASQASVCVLGDTCALCELDFKKQPLSLESHLREPTTSRAARKRLRRARAARKILAER